jgi:hypothetical protein
VTLNTLYKHAEPEGIEIDGFHTRKLPSVSFPEGWIAIDTRKMHTKTEEKATLAHEIGHCETGSFYNIHSPCDIKAHHKWRANKRSYEILVPY